MKPTVKYYVKGGVQETSKGLCLGFGKGRNPEPYCHVPDHAKQLLDMIIVDFKQVAPNFTFTSVQINVDLAAKPHVDGSNLGQSAILALGPHTGGAYWTVDGDGSVTHNVYGRWLLADGRVPHGNLPFYGQRVSCIAFTHSASMADNAKVALHSAASHGFPLPHAQTGHAPRAHVEKT